jgi:hypothetical protein
MYGLGILVASVVGAALLARLVGRSFWRSLIFLGILMAASVALSNSLGYRDFSGVAVIFAAGAILMLIASFVFFRRGSNGKLGDIELSDDERTLLDIIFQLSHSSTSELINRSNVVVAGRFEGSYGRKLLRGLQRESLVQFRPIGYLVITEAGIVCARSAQGLPQPGNRSAPPVQPIRVVPTDQGQAPT